MIVFITILEKAPDKTLLGRSQNCQSFDIFS